MARTSARVAILPARFDLSAVSTMRWMARPFAKLLVLVEGNPSMYR